MRTQTKRQTKRSNGYGAWPAIRERQLEKWVWIPEMSPGLPVIPLATGNLPLERPWNAITVAAPAPPTGEINAAWVRVGGASVPHTEFPVSLARNTEVIARVRGRNTSGRTVRMQFIVQLRDPTGRLRSSGVIIDNFPHNTHVLVETSPAIPLDADGTWVINAILRRI